MLDCQNLQEIIHEINVHNEFQGQNEVAENLDMYYNNYYRSE